MEHYAKQANKGHRQLIFELEDWLFPRGDGPFQVLEHINDNAYNLDFPGEYNVSATFNVTDLRPFDVGDDLRTNPFEEEENDKGMTNKWNVDLIQVLVGPVTRA
ncbi:hypothetical protein AAG906_019682 [Vitis piasezkii]